jgi:uncharacterized protein (TIGR00369 family)
MTDQLPSHLTQLTPGAALLGREFLGFDADGTTASIRFQARAEFANRHGGVLGGFLAAMLDSATGLTLLVGLPPELTAVTTHLDTEFVKPAPIGTLLAKARVTSRDERKCRRWSRNPRCRRQCVCPGSSETAHRAAAMTVCARPGLR